MKSKTCQTLPSRLVTEIIAYDALLPLSVLFWYCTVCDYSWSSSASLPHWGPFSLNISSCWFNRFISVIPNVGAVSGQWHCSGPKNTPCDFTAPHPPFIGCFLCASATPAVAIWNWWIRMISQPVVGTVFCMCCTVTGRRDSPSSSSTAGVCCGSRDGGTIWKLLCCSAVMDHAAGMSAALDFVIVHQAWVCVRIHSAPP